jgi:hypothetical protein
LTKYNSCLYYDEKNLIRGWSSGFLIAVLKVEVALRRYNIQIHGGLPKLERWAVFTFTESSWRSVKHRDYFTLRLNYFDPYFCLWEGEMPKLCGNIYVFFFNCTEQPRYREIVQFIFQR